MIRATPPVSRALANPHKCGILNSQGGRRWQQRALRTEHEDLWRGDFRTSQRARAHAEGLAAQIKKKDGTAIGLAYINDIEHDRRGPQAPDFVAQLAAVLGVPLDVLQFYAGRLPADAPEERRDPSHQQIVAAYRAFRRELQKKRGDRQRKREH